MPVAEVVTNGQPHTTVIYEKFLDAIANAKAKYTEVKRGDRLQLGSTTLAVLHPTGPTGSNLNDQSIVLRLVYGQTTFLFDGDAEQTAEASMLLSSVSPVKADILKVGHHGSRSASSPEFLKAVKPQVAIYSAGAGNDYGHPHSETLAALGCGRGHCVWHRCQRHRGCHGRWQRLQRGDQQGGLPQGASGGSRPGAHDAHRHTGGADSHAAPAAGGRPEAGHSIRDLAGAAGGQCHAYGEDRSGGQVRNHRVLQVWPQHGSRVGAEGRRCWRQCFVDVEGGHQHHAGYLAHCGDGQQGRQHRHQGNHIHGAIDDANKGGH